MGQYDALLKPLTIKNVTFRNRVFSSSHSPGYAKGGHITDRYLRYHAEKAKGGIGLTQFGGATGVSIENSYHYGQVNGSEDWIIPEYQKMAAGIHKHGAKCTVQLTHGGRRERWDAENWFPAYSPSCRREPVHKAFPAEMEDHDIRRIVKDYGQAVRRAKEGHLDGVELSFQAGTLIEQFWSPAMNFRTDRYGGSVENRVRFGLEVLEEVRKVNGDYLVGIRMPGDEMLKDGLNQRDCIEIAKIYAKSGMVDFISIVAAQGADAVSSALIWPTMWVPPGGWLPLASAVKAEVDVPIIHAARIADLPTANRAVEEGHVDMVGMTRAFLADPHLLKKAMEGREDDIRQCVGAGYCVDRVISGHDTLCIQNAAMSREAAMPHVIAKTANGVKRAVVVGAGPGGLEAARVLAERGHKVTLFEREAETGGQVNIAAKAPWRVSIQGVQRWLDGQVRKLGVDIRTGVEAKADDVMALKPDVVIVATGGHPNKGWYTGSDLAVSTWDILSGKVEPADNVLLFDESGAQQGASTAEFIAKRGSKVEIATTDRTICMELGDTNAAAFLKELYQAGVLISPDLRLTNIYREGNQLVAVLANVFTQQEEERVVDQVVAECGTMPNDALYFALKPLAKNLGEVDLRSVADAGPSALEVNPNGAFQLFRVGDAWASRNIHAAIYDSLRLCKDI